MPPLAWRRGDFSSLLGDGIQLIDPRTGKPIPGNIIPDSLIDPAGAEILSFYPNPDDPNAAVPTGATVSPVGHSTIRQFTTRVDHYVGSENHLFSRYSIWDEDRFTATGFPRVTPGVNAARSR